MKFRRNFGLIFALIPCRVAYQPVDWFTKKIWYPTECFDRMIITVSNSNKLPKITFRFWSFLNFLMRLLKINAHEKFQKMKLKKKLKKNFK